MDRPHDFYSDHRRHRDLGRTDRRYLYLSEGLRTTRAFRPRVFSHVGPIAVAAMLIAPRGLWPIVRDHFGIQWLGVSQRLPIRALDAPEQDQLQNEEAADE